MQRAPISLLLVSSLMSANAVADPRPTPSGGFYVQVSAGFDHACALRADGAVFCWGANFSGALGVGHTPFFNVPPTQVALPRVAQVSGGADHTCFRLRDGRVACAGANSDGRLGDGTTTSSNVPVFAAGIDDAFSVAAGSAATCAIRAGGDVYCWGDNTDSLGTGDTEASVLTPTPVVGIDEPVREISLLRQRTAVTLRGSLYCWGDNAFGECGTGDFRPTPEPTLVGGLPAPVLRVVAHGEFTCAETFGLQTFCWGNDQFGQLADGTVLGGGFPDFSRPTPGLSHLPADVLGIANAPISGCATRLDGSVLCWGLDVRDHSIQPEPIAVAGFDRPMRAVTVGQSFACTVGFDGSVWCWGDNSIGELGVTGIEESATPVRVPLP